MKHPSNLGCLTPAQATLAIRETANHNPKVHWTGHAKTQMSDRDLIMGDVLFVLRNGFVHVDGKPATQAGYFRYCMECTSPNSGGRTVRTVVIPGAGDRLKIVSVMWADEPMIGG